MAEIDSNLKKELEDLENMDNINLIGQVQAEHQVSFDYMDSKRDKWESLMKIYNNQKRDKNAIGDPLMFTILQTVIASLYDDKMATEFIGREEGDQSAADNLTSLALFDFDVMDKDLLDYDWTFDAAFFGKGFLLFNEFNRKLKTPIPHKINPMTFLHDPRAVSMDGHFGDGAARFWGREIMLTKRQMKMNPAYFDIDELVPGEEFNSLTKDEQQARDDQQGMESQTEQDLVLPSSENDYFNLLEWYTYIDGKKHIVTLGNERGHVVRVQELKDQDTWGVIERQIYPTSGSFWGTSIPDLVEDKQRLRAKLQNIAAKSVEFNTFGMYMYDNNRITNISELARPAPNKLIGIDGDVNGAIQPIPRDQVKQDVQYLMDILNANAEKSTATPAIQQGATPDTSRTATEQVIQRQSVDSRYGLAAKMFGNSEKRFWRRWYQLYKNHFKSGIDEKILRVTGPLGYEWRPLHREDIVSGKNDPDIRVQSKVISEAERLTELQAMSNVQQILAQNPNLNRNFMDKRLAKLSGMTPDEVKLLIPPTAEDLHAEQENLALNENKSPKVSIEDDHMAHLEIHNKSSDTAAKRAHIAIHLKAMQEARTMKEQLPITEEGIAGVPGEEQATGPQPTAPQNQNQQQISPTRLNFNDLSKQ